MFAIPNSLRSFFRPLFNALGMGSLPEDYSATHSVFPDKKSHFQVEVWAKLVTAAYLSNPVSREWEVTHIARYKEPAGSQHEYLVATVKHGDMGEIRLRIERGRDAFDENRKPVLTEIQKAHLAQADQDTDKSGLWTSAPNVVLGNGVDPKNLPEHSSSAFKTLKDRYIKKVGSAVDVVMLYDDSSKKTDELIASLSLAGRETPMPLAHLAILSKVVHDEETLYNLFNAQCYWYSNVIACVIAKQQNFDFMAVRSASPTEGDSDFCFHPRSGKYYRIAIHKIRQDVVNSMEATLVQRLKEFERAAAEADREREAEARKRETEARKAAEADREREAEARKRETEARKAAEADTEREAEARKAAEKELEAMRKQLLELE
ncbi:hypothetical protein BDZ97DRAFT_1802851 [Flammula alnicola]|nr:hypothetical protein BDZ97DRAFT_1802851 [Flammula alnicola]